MTKDVEKYIGEEIDVRFLSNSYDNCQYEAIGTLVSVDETSIVIERNNNKIQISFLETECGEAIQSITVVSEENKLFRIFRNEILENMSICPFGMYPKSYSEKIIEACEILLNEAGFKKTNKSEKKGK